MWDMSELLSERLRDRITKGQTVIQHALVYEVEELEEKLKWAARINEDLINERNAEIQRANELEDQLAKLRRDVAEGKQE
jgi:hypothetical protein